MVKQLAELHGGSVAVASAEGEGSCFTVWLPLRTDAEAAAVVRPSVRPDVVLGDGFERRSALVVDADEQSAELVRLLLEAEGFAVLHATSAEHALELAAAQPLNVIALALELAGTEGWELLLRLRNVTTLAHVPVVIVAGHVKGNLALTSGTAAVLQKPISRAQLKASLEDLGLQATPSAPAPCWS